jgi:hypothetical protein
MRRIGVLIAAAFVLTVFASGFPWGSPARILLGGCACAFTVGALGLAYVLANRPTR